MCFRVVSEDSAGIVLDGIEEDTDADYQTDTTSISMHFHSFVSKLCEIEHYQWAVGNSLSELESEKGFSSDGIVLTGNAFNGSGYAQVLLPNLDGKRHFISVRALTACGKTLQATSDGIMIDSSPPHVAVDLKKSQHNSYTSDIHAMVASWSVHDSQSNTDKTDVSVGSYPEGEDILARTRSEATSLHRGEVTVGQEGLPHFVTIYSKNHAGAQQRTTSKSLTVDTSAPAIGKVSMVGV